MMRPLIGLTVGPTTARDGLEYARLRMTYVRAVECAGGLPVLVPPLEDPATLTALLQRLDGVLLPGGADVDPAEYGEAINGSQDINPALDRLELAVARWAIEASLPTLGICRGQQLLNVALGGTLVQHIDAHAPQGARDALTHEFHVAPDSRLARVLGATDLRVNSHHHQAVKQLGNGLEAVAWSDDGTIEGVESLAHPWLLAVQFHPEDLVTSHEQSRRLMEAFVEACRSRKPSPAGALR